MGFHPVLFVSYSFISTRRVAAFSNWKPANTLIRNLVEVVSRGGNYLLNVGPTAEGEFPPESIAILSEMGKWMKVNGEAVYGTKASPWGLFPWGRCTKKETSKGTTLYFSVFEWPSNGKLTIPGFKNSVFSARILGNSTKLKTTTSKDGELTISLPASAPDPVATVIRAEVRGKITDQLIKEQKK